MLERQHFFAFTSLYYRNKYKKIYDIISFNCDSFKKPKMPLKILSLCIRVLLKRVDRKTEIQTNNLHAEGSRTLRVVV